VRVLFAAMALHLALQRDEALALLGAASQSLAGSAPDLAEGPHEALTLSDAVVARADALILGRPDLVALAAAYTDRHAWAHPALMSLLNAARLRAGVLAPAHFAWLKLVDRSLWYALHALGFESEGMGRYLHPNPCVEALAARDHWALERAVGQPIEHPRFEQALLALRDGSGADGVAPV
jgi:intracellular multiplication protein IcmP